MKKRILIDLDGVLANWFAAAAAYFGRTEEEALAAMPPGSHDTHAAFGFAAEDEMWAEINKASSVFWSNIPIYGHAKVLLDECAKAAKGRVAIATKPARDAGSAHGKVVWMKEHLGEGFRDYIISPLKHWLAFPGALLIDDWSKNTEAFEKHGGKAILFPRKWNERHADHDRALELTVEAVRKWASS